MIFNNVTRGIFSSLKDSWASQKLGTMVCVDHDDAMSTHAMFADDTTLLASSRKNLCKTIRDTKDALAVHGLSLNIDKCMVQTNRRELGPNCF